MNPDDILGAKILDDWQLDLLRKSTRNMPSFSSTPASDAPATFKAVAGGRMAGKSQLFDPNMLQVTPPAGPNLQQMRGPAGQTGIYLSPEARSLVEHLHSLFDQGQVIREEYIARAKLPREDIDAVIYHLRHDDRVIYLRDRREYRYLTTPLITTEPPLMIDTLIKTYDCYMEQDVRSPILHMAGPPGVGKSDIAAELASMVGGKLHVLNVSRISPLEIEGVQMPTDHPTEQGKQHLTMLHSTLWTQLREGDVLLLDEFMRGFPEVYNGLLDILTSREVAGFKLPKVFVIAASNSIAAYDKALEDRLLHLFVPDLRNDSKALARAKQLLIDRLGLNPKVKSSSEMSDLFSNEVLPMYAVLDQFSGKAQVGATSTKGQSLRKLIGQTQLRHVDSQWLADLIDVNNRMSMNEQKPQYVIVLDGAKAPAGYETRARQMEGNPRLTPIQATNLRLNLRLIEMEEARKEITPTTGRNDLDDDLFA